MQVNLLVWQFYPTLTIQMNCVATVAAPWVIFPPDKRHIFWFTSASEHDMKLISVQSSQRHCAILQIWPSIHHQQGSLLFLSLYITQTECHHLTELPYNISPFFFLCIFSRGQTTTGKKKKMPLMQSRSYPPPFLVPALLRIATHRSFACQC